MTTTTSELRPCLGLMRRRACWWPTSRAFVLLVLLLLALGATAFLRVYPFLAVNDGGGPGPVALVGWHQRRTLLTAIEEHRRHPEWQLFVCGSTLDRDAPAQESNSWADFSARAIARLGLPKEEMVIIRGPSKVLEPTYDCAQALREWMNHHGGQPAQLTLVTTGPDARRSRMLFQKAFGDRTAVRVLDVPNSSYDPARWWTVSEGVREVVSELLGYGYDRLFFQPLGTMDFQVIYGILRLKE